MTVKEFAWRFDYMRYFRKQTGFPWLFCVSAARATEYDEESLYTPVEAVMEELSYWDLDE